MAKIITAYQSVFNPQKISLSEEEIVRFDFVIERQTRVSDYLAKNLAISKEDDLKARVTEFLVSGNVFFDLWEIFDSTDFENFLKKQEEEKNKMGVGSAAANSKAVTQLIKPNLENVY